MLIGRVRVILSALLVVAASAADAQVADLVIRNADVLQCNAEMAVAEALAVKDGRLVAVGRDRDIDSWIADTTRVIDAEGRTLTPGLIDSHVHFLGLGESLQILDLADADTWEAIVDRVQEASRSIPKGSWIEGRAGINRNGQSYRRSTSTGIPTM